jgi:hypothetical protein
VLLFLVRYLRLGTRLPGYGSRLFHPFSQFSLEVHNPKTKMVFTEFKSAQGNGTSKQKTKGGKNKLMNMQNNTQNSDSSPVVSKGLGNGAREIA